MDTNEVEKEFRSLIENGVYPIVSLSLFDSINNINITSSNKDYFIETLDSYKRYLKDLDELPNEIKQAFLLTLKESEIFSNQEVENEDKFLIRLYGHLEETNSIDIGTLLFKNGNLSVEDLQTIHQVLMEGTSNYSTDSYKLRQRDTHFVGSIQNGKRLIHYFPIRSEENYKAMSLISEFLNKEITNEEDILIQPFIVHGLISAVQSFSDGNTRLARLIQHLKIWQLSNKLGISYINLPAIYMSKSYYQTRTSYREHIFDIAVNGNDDAWNKWFRYNLNMFNEQLYFGINNLEKIGRR